MNTPPTPQTIVKGASRNQLVMLGLGALCLGVIIGFKLAGGEPLVIDRPVFVERDCEKCKEKSEESETFPKTGTFAVSANEPNQETIEVPEVWDPMSTITTPGDSSVPDDGE